MPQPGAHAAITRPDTLLLHCRPQLVISLAFMMFQQFTGINAIIFYAVRGPASHAAALCAHKLAWPVLAPYACSVPPCVRMQNREG